MLHIAQAKKKENIAEYVLFMWQMEDLLRGVSFDVSKLEESILVEISDDELRSKNVRWFEDLASEMKKNKVQVSGHLPETTEIVHEISILQHSLLTVLEDEKFRKLYAEVSPIIKEFRAKASKVPENDVETVFTALYGVLILRLAGKEISKETNEAVAQFQSYVKYLSKSYRDMKAGLLPMNN